MKRNAGEPPRLHGRYLRIPSWASVRCRTLATLDPSASSVSIEIEKHRPIPVKEPIVPEELHGGPAADGLLFDGAECLSPGTLIEIEFAFQPDDAPVRLRGEVIDAKACDEERDRYQIRMGFIAGTEAEVDVIAQFVKKFYS
jgi:hypothetical protein